MKVSTPWVFMAVTMAAAVLVTHPALAQLVTGGGQDPGVSWQAFENWLLGNSMKIMFAIVLMLASFAFVASWRIGMAVVGAVIFIIGLYYGAPFLVNLMASGAGGTGG
jgi:type IV secretory pathway VirB2 component (pilin)